VLSAAAVTALGDDGGLGELDIIEERIDDFGELDIGEGVVEVAGGLGTIVVVFERLEGAATGRPGEELLEDVDVTGKDDVEDVAEVDDSEEGSDVVSRSLIGGFPGPLPIAGTMPTCLLCVGVATGVEAVSEPSEVVMGTIVSAADPAAS